MKVLILGGSRFIGKFIADTAANAGHEVHLFNRGKSAPDTPYKLIQGDLDNLPEFREQFKALAPDVIVHCMALTEADSERSIQAFEGLDTQLFVLGSADCYHAFQQLNRGHETGEMPLDENSPTSNIRYYYRDVAPGLKYHDYDKNLMTDVLMQAGTEGKIRPTVFRLPMVYGPEDYQFAHRHGAIIRRILDKQSRFVLGETLQQTIWSFAHVENIAAAIVHGFGQALDQDIYNLSEPTVRSWRRWIELFSTAADFPFEIHTVPDVLLDADTKPNAPPKHILVDAQAYRLKTGFHEPVSLEAGIASTLAWGMSHPDILGPSPDYAAEERALNYWQQALSSYKTG